MYSTPETYSTLLINYKVKISETNPLGQTCWTVSSRVSGIRLLFCSLIQVLLTFWFVKIHENLCSLRNIFPNVNYTVLKS